MCPKSKILQRFLAPYHSVKVDLKTNEKPKVHSRGTCRQSRGAKCGRARGAIATASALSPTTCFDASTTSPTFDFLVVCEHVTPSNFLAKASRIASLVSMHGQTRVGKRHRVVVTAGKSASVGAYIQGLARRFATRRWKR